MHLSQTEKDRFRRLKRLDQIQALDPIEFEKFVGWLYQRDGYGVQTTVTSGDEGVDLRLRKNKRTVIVQCKRYQGTVGQPTVRDLYGAMHHVGADEAHLVTSGRISRQAESWVVGKPIELIDGYDLVAWVNKNRRSRMASQQRNSRLLMISVALLVVLVVAGVSVYAAFSVLDQRLLLPTPPALVIPTRPGTPAPEDVDVVDGGGGPSGLVPTVTLAGGPAGGQATAVRVSTPPTLDGTLDEWRSIEPIAAPYRVYAVENWDGTADLEATWRLSWDDEFLYFAVQVVDDTHVQNQTGAATFKGDSLDLQLDTNRLGDLGPAVSPDDYQLAFSPGNFADLPPEAYRFRGNNNGQMVDFEGHQLRVAATRTANGYVLEGAVPWSDIGVTPAAGLQMGANLNASDNDSPGSAVQEVMISNVSTRTFRDPTTWGSLTLVDR